MQASISFVIPCYNSADTITDVIAEIEDIVAPTEMRFEIITVIDGSPDNVLEVLTDLAASRPHLKIIELSKNFGRTNALMAGYNYANGLYTVTLDDDGQCPLDQLWNLLQPLEDGFDMSVAKYPKKEQSFFKNIGSRINGYMARKLIGFPKNFEMSNFYAFNSLVRCWMIRYTNPYPYLSGLAYNATHRVTNVTMKERKRSAGSSNYTFSKLLNQWLNGFTNFSIAPLRIANALGVFTAFIGFVFGIYAIIRRLLDSSIASGYSSLIAAILFVGGITMILLGLIGEYIGRIFICINETPQYLVRYSNIAPTNLHNSDNWQA